ncbi:major facilitator transporter [Caballeronia calidae]|uniref:Major facilitator transporter n=1 Tax=Caballeronia calidae TaxID=1777139 RepID=A0A158DUZ5_9BURK|nr:MFS transporter [Caballeronia calidae]SAK98469.1 major facilitator transporter [Caballeronia calidae]
MHGPNEHNHVLTGDAELQTIKKVTWRILPLVILCYFFAYLDRTNVGVGALQMNKDIGLTASMFGFGSGLFFIMYFTMEVPSNLFMFRYGVRRWLARIMFTWGLVAGGMAFVKGPIGFYAMRALLGAAKAGFYPAIVYYFAQWFPAEYRARVLGYLNVAGPLTFLIGAPISGALLNVSGLGLHGWQWMFIIEAIPAIILAVVVLKYLPDNPGTSTWLKGNEATWLSEKLAQEAADIHEHVRDYTVVQALLSPPVLVLGFFMFNVVITVYSVGFFLPQIVSSFGLSSFHTGVVSALPYIAGCIGMLLVGWRSDVTRERYFHVAIPMFVAAVGLALAAMSSDLTIKIIAFGLVSFGSYGCVPAFWSLPSTFMSGKAMAGGIAVINSIGALGGFAGLWIMGFLKDATGSFSGGLYFLAGMDGLAVLAILLVRLLLSRQRKKDSRAYDKECPSP